MMKEQNKEAVRFIIARLAVVSVSICIAATYAHTLNLFKRAEWLVYALSSHAFVIGYIAAAHLLAIPLFFVTAKHRSLIENTLNVLTIFASLYFMLGFYVLRVG